MCIPLFLLRIRGEELDCRTGILGAQCMLLSHIAGNSGVIARTGDHATVVWKINTAKVALVSHTTSGTGWLQRHSHGRDKKSENKNVTATGCAR
jgi:hypothetical protein